jgi:hypothetical protein
LVLHLALLLPAGGCRICIYLLFRRVPASRCYSHTTLQGFRLYRPTLSNLGVVAPLSCFDVLAAVYRVAVSFQGGRINLTMTVWRSLLTCAFCGRLVLGERNSIRLPQILDGGCFVLATFGVYQCHSLGRSNFEMRVVRGLIFEFERNRRTVSAPVPLILSPLPL